MRKYQNGSALVEFSIVALFFLTAIFATLGIGIDSVNRWQAGEKVEDVLKRAENAYGLVNNAIPLSLCMKSIKEDEGEWYCGFNVSGSSCDDIAKKSFKKIEEDCNGDYTCIFWETLYSVAKSVEKVSNQQEEYLYGIAANNEECRAPYAVVFPGFSTKQKNEDGTIQKDLYGFTLARECQNEEKYYTCSDSQASGCNVCSYSLKERLKRGDTIAVKSRIANLLLSYVGKDEETKTDITHYGNIRYGFDARSFYFTNTPTPTPEGIANTPTVTNTPTPTNTLTATVTPTGTYMTETPTITPTATATRTPECELYDVSFHEGSSLSAVGNLEITQHGEIKDKCMQDIIGYASKSYYAYDDDKKVKEIYKRYFSGQHCEAENALYNESSLHMRNWNRYFKKYWCDTYKNDNLCEYYKKNPINYYYASDSNVAVCLDTTFYLDRNCHVVTETEGKQICGGLDIKFYTSSPISLLWNENANVDENMSVVKFNLDLTKSDEWYAWKGSGDAPLLVYDPENTKQVKDASMLFGNFAFGGKSKNENGEIEPWENGFEALKTLDKNNNGRIEGDELKGVYLWFDNNKNAISEEGEIKRLDEMGVKALFTNSYEVNETTKNIHMKVGYERDVLGNITTGEMVDWYTVGAPSEAALVRYFSILKQNNEEANKENNVENNDNSATTPPSNEEVEKAWKEELSKVERKFGGEWKWYLTNDETKDVDLNTLVSQGEFMLADGPAGLVHGATFTETFIKSSPENNLNSYVNGFLLIGEASREGEQDILNFERVYGNEKSVNKAVLSSDKNSMEGETTIINNETNNVVISYKWKAIRVH